jgi:hypothetical protein
MRHSTAAPTTHRFSETVEYMKLLKSVGGPFLLTVEMTLLAGMSGVCDMDVCLKTMLEFYGCC